MKQGKYVGYKFNADQKKARNLWKFAQKQETGIVDGLMVSDFSMSRKELHKRLDRRLDQIERLRKQAKELFPEVSESFVVASMEVTF